MSAGSCQNSMSVCTASTRSCFASSATHASCVSTHGHGRSKNRCSGRQMAPAPMTVAPEAAAASSIAIGAVKFCFGTVAFLASAAAAPGASVSRSATRHAPYAAGTRR